MIAAHSTSCRRGGRSGPWHRRRLRGAADSAGPRSPGHHRLQPGGRAFPPRVASAGLGRAPLPGPRAERHRRDGRHPRAAFLSLALPPSCRRSGWTVHRRTAEAGGAIFGSARGRRHGAVARRRFWPTSWCWARFPREAVLRSARSPATSSTSPVRWVRRLLRSEPAYATEKLRPKSSPKHFYPEPRIAVGQFLREKKLASAMIDISDGLSTDLGHICDESKTGAVVYAESCPLIPWRAQGWADVSHCTAATSTSCSSPRGRNRRIPKQIAGVPVTRIGEIAWQAVEARLRRTARQRS